MDFHACPIVKGLIPDVGGMVMMGSPTVMINSMMACRVMDMVVEIPGGPNPIAMGATNVFIGDSGGGGGGAGAGMSKAVSMPTLASMPAAAAAQAASLKYAADFGYPFCEKCQHVTDGMSSRSTVEEAAKSAAQTPATPLASPVSDSLDHQIDFNFKTESGDPIDDKSGFKLIHPGGRVEDGKLANGSFKRSGVRQGSYRMKFKYIDHCAWESKTALGEPKIAMNVVTSGMDDGTEVVFNVFQRFHSQTAPRATFKAKLHANKATAHFEYRQNVGESPGGEFIFEVNIGRKIALSDVLKITRYSISQMKGVQQRLKELGYDPGPIDGICGPRTKEAVEDFQTDNPELVVDGIPGPLTKRELNNTW
jgi:hypothetical protein